MRLAAVVSCSLLLMGCYQYHPVESSQPAAGAYLRIELSDAGSIRLSPTMGIGITNVEGNVTSVDAQGMTLALRSVSRRGAASTDWTGEPLALTAADIRNVRQRTPSRGRTIAALTGVTLGGATIIIAIARAAGRLSGNDGRPGPPPAT